MAFVCGAIVGFEREKGRKPAGLRTQILICLGSAIFTMASISPGVGATDKARIAAQIVTGVGFLGAGSILRDRHQLVGLTTAATIWTVAAIGIVVGVGYVTAGVLLSVGVLLVLGAFRKVESLFGGHCTCTRLAIVYHPENGKVRALILSALDDAHGQNLIENETVRPDGNAEMVISYCDRHRDHRAFLADLAVIPAVQGLETPAPKT